MSTRPELSEEELILARQLREWPHAEPSADLDARILMQARAATQTGRVASRRRSRRPLLTSLASAAALVLAVGVVWQVTQEPPDDSVLQRPAQPELRSAPSPAGARMEDSDDSGMDLRAPVLAEESAPASPLAAQRRPEPPSEPQAARAAEGEAEVIFREPPPPAPAPKASAQDSVALPPLAPSAPPAPPPSIVVGRQQRDAPAAAARARSEADSAAAENERAAHIDRLEDRTERAPEAVPPPAPPAPSAPAALQAMAEPEQAIKQIRQLIVIGQTIAAAERLDELRRMHPDFELPDDLLRFERDHRQP